MPTATVVHVITLLELGGAQEITLFACRHLDRGRFAVHLIAGRGGFLDDEARAIPDLDCRFLDSLVREVRPATDVRALVETTRALREIRARAGGPLIVHTHSSKAGIVGRVAAKLAGADAIVHSIHGFGFHPEQRPIVRGTFQALERMTAPFTDAFCPVSEANRDVARELGLFRHDPEVLLTPSGIDPVEYEPREGDREAVRAEIGVPPAAPLVGMIACLKPQKAPVDFVRVAGRVAERHPDCHFLIAGDGELRPEVERAARELGIEDRFHLLGWRRDVRRILGAIDVLALTSIFEGLPRVLLQAMAARRPAVASAVDGVPEAVRDGVTGFLLAPHDVAGFADRIGTLIADPARARAMGEAARGELGRYDGRRMLREVESLYERLVENAARA